MSRRFQFSHVYTVLAAIAPLLVLPQAAGAAPTLKSTAELLGYKPTDKLLIINADDCGMSHSTNQAIFDAFEHGVLTSTTVMMPTAWVKEVLDWAKLHPQAGIGIHLTLTSEWGGYKWGPIAGRAAVPGLVGPDGYLWGDSDEVWKHATLQEAETEGRAQIDLARKLGIEPTHVDSHMGTLQENAEFWKVYLKLAAEYKIPQRQASAAAYEALGGKGMKEAERAAGVLGPDELLFQLQRPKDPSGVPAYYEQILRNLKPGLTEMYLHPAIDGPEMQSISSTHAFRDADYRWLIDPKTKALIDELGIKLIGYRELLDAMRKGVARQRFRSGALSTTSAVVGLSKNLSARAGRPSREQWVLHIGGRAQGVGMRFWPLTVAILVAMSCLAEDAPQPLQPAAVPISTSEKPLGPQPTVIVGAEAGIAGEYVRRGTRYLGCGLASRVAFERRFEGGFALRGQIAPFYAFQGGDLGETIFDVAVAAGGQRWLAGGTVVGGYTYYARNTNPANRAYMGSNTQEAYAGIEFTGPGRPFAYLRYDFDKGVGRRNDRVGAYLVAGASHRVDLNPDIAFEFLGRVGFDFGRGVGGFSDAQLTSRMEMKLANHLTLVPALDWWFPAGSVAPGVNGFRLVPSLGLRYNASF